MNSTTGPQADIEKIFVTSDGSVKAVYRDNSLLLLSSTAASFTRVSAAGVKTVQITECCLSRWKPLLAELLAFRNQNLDVPCVPIWLQRQLQDAHGLLFSTGYPVTNTTWPATAEEAVEAGLVKLTDDHTLQLYSCCGSAFVTLQPTGLRFAVCFPLLLSHDATNSTYTYLQHTQVFSRNQYPTRWQHPVEVAVAAAGIAAQSSTMQQQEQWLPTHHHHTQQQQQLQDVTNRLSLLATCCSPQTCRSADAYRHEAAPAWRSPCSSPGPNSRPNQQQHQSWQHLGPVEPSAGQHRRRLLGPSSSGAWDEIVARANSPGASCPPAPSSSVQDAAAAAAPWVSPGDGSASRCRPWCPPGSPGSPTAALYAVAEQQQQQQHAELQMVVQQPQYNSHHWPPHPSPAVRFSSSLQCVVQLPMMPSVLQDLPTRHSLQSQQPQQHQTGELLGPLERTSPVIPAGQVGASTNRSSAAPRFRHHKSHIASALAQALGQHQQGSSSSSSSGPPVGCWWLEPHLLLPTDELLAMVWTQEATHIFLEDVSEVEVWVHADDSCLFSFQSGAFITHLQPQAALAPWDTSATAATIAPAAHRPQHSHPSAAEPASGFVATHRVTTEAACDGGGSGTGVDAHADAASILPCNQQDCADVSASSRVYAVSSLPGDLVVPSLSPEVRQHGVLLPLGRIASEALRLRSTMVRVKASLATAALSTPAAAAQQAGFINSYRQQQQQPVVLHQHQQQQQQPVLSLEVVEDQDVPGVGHFTAYADGRVRVVFADRTLLNLGADRRHVHLILPDGSKREVAASKPEGVEDYVQAALEFATWSSHTPIERAAALRMQALVSAELRSSARMAAICEWGSNPQCLPAVTGDLGRQLSLQAPLLLAVDAQVGPNHLVEDLLQANRLLLERL